MSAPAIATEIYPWEIKCMAGSLDKAQTANKSEPTCTSETKINPSCSEITDDFCNALWSKDNKGNLTMSEGRILSGKSSKSELSIAFLENLKARLDGEKNLPPDLQEKAGPIYDDLRKALAEEQDSKQWYRKIDAINDRWAKAFEDVAEERTWAKHPELKNIKDKDLTIEQRAMFKEDSLEVSRQLVDAKYKDHPNWKRVEKVYGDVKSDLILKIGTLNIPQAQKDKLTRRVEKIELTLPYEGLKGISADGDCSGTTKNAFYHPLHHKFTVCAGIFNTLQSDSALYFIIAHEISHSIDSGINAAVESETSELAKALNPLAGSEKAVYSCNDWKKIVAKAKQIKAPNLKKTDPLQNLYDCTVPKEGLKKWDTNTLNIAADATAKDTISHYASYNAFTKIAQPTITENGETRPNPYYMRPDRYRALQDSYEFGVFSGEERVPDIFNQSLTCAEGTSKGKTVLYKDASPEDRKEIFAKAIEETQMIEKAKELESYSYCGINCDSLSDYEMSKGSGENFADWMAGQSFGEFLSRQKDMRSRRESSAAATSLFCNAPGVARDAPDLTLKEKNYSLEPHPDNRNRRVSLYNDQNAKLVKCDINEKDQGFGKCKPK
ncbi:hypothetical protein D3C72_713690 [compost metagenome]